MPTFVADGGKVTVPGWVTSIDAFRRWLDSDEAPEKARTWFLDGEVWVDMSKEQLFTHVDVKGAIFAVLWALVHAARAGRVYQDGLLLTNPAAGLSGNPDAVYVSHAAVADGRVRKIPGAEVGFVELEGTPDMVLEVVSDSSEKKDNQVLREAYWEAGIPEYWLVDARGEDVEFDILQHGPKGYKAARKSGGWAKSAVFGKSFKLTRGDDPNGNPEFTLEVK
ncbi:MAG: Uma2 family endonuclease [Gemmataceae bacterium]|nr:Uma2 family endonuclease [Gemmataceae bacterium]